MRILFIGDVVSASGCDFVRQVLPSFKKQQEIDFCIVNGENSAVGNGILPVSAEHLLKSGADIITTGNHALRRHEIYSVLDEANSCIMRPQNMHRSAPGKGAAILEKRGMRLGVANIMGSVYMDYAENPFDCADSVINYFNGEGVKCSVIDFHAEATSEKRAMGFYVDSKVGALLGTHTHVQTSDEQILPGGTAYITDAGMTGVKNSVLGVKTEISIYKLRTGLPSKFENPEGGCFMGCVIVTLNSKTGKAEAIERFTLE